MVLGSGSCVTSQTTCLFVLQMVPNGIASQRRLVDLLRNGWFSRWGNTPPEWKYVIMGWNSFVLDQKWFSGTWRASRPQWWGPRRGDKTKATAAPRDAESLWEHLAVKYVNFYVSNESCYFLIHCFFPLSPQGVALSVSFKCGECHQWHPHAVTTGPELIMRVWLRSVALSTSGCTWTVSVEGWYEHFSTWHNLAAFSAHSALGSGLDKAQSDSFSPVSVGGVTQTRSAPTPGYVLSQVSFFFFWPQQCLDTALHWKATFFFFFLFS